MLDHEIGSAIIARDRSCVGIVIGEYDASCEIEDCSGTQLRVWWGKKRKVTKVCTSGVEWDDKYCAWRIQ